MRTPYALFNIFAQTLKMKRFIYLYIILIGIMVPAQQSENRFEQAEYNYAAPGAEAIQEDGAQPEPSDGVTEKCCGNPAPPTPIDDYLSLLIVSAVGIIAWQGYKKTRTA